MAVEKRAYSIPEFCEAYSISRAKVYLTWAEGVGPTRTKIGARVVILVTDAEQWIAGHREQVPA